MCENEGDSEHLSCGAAESNQRAFYTPAEPPVCNECVVMEKPTLSQALGQGGR